MVLKADRSLSIQDQFTKKPSSNFAVASPLLTGFTSWVNNVNGIPRYGDVRRDRVLAEFWKDEPILAGALNTLIKRMKSTGYNIEGGRNNAIKWARKLQDANDGRGWQDFITRWTQDYLTTDLGAIIELGVDQEFKPQKLYNIDSLKCHPWPDQDFPMLYLQPDGKVIKLAREQIIHLSDMTSPREEQRGRGFCAISRLLRAAESITAIYDYELQKMGKLPPQAVASIAGVTKQQFLDAWEQYKEQRSKEGLDIYTGIFWIGGDDPNMPVKIELTDFASLPDGFDRNIAVESWVKTVALNLGVDVGELWLIQHVGATKGSQTVQHQKALGKGTGEIHAMLEMALNVRVLPYDVTFSFDFQDDEQDRQSSEIMMNKINNLIALYTQSSRGPANVGGLEAPFGRSGAANVSAPQDDPNAKKVTTGTPTGATTTPPANIADMTPPLITRDQAIDLGTRWGIFPAGFFGQEVMTVAGMILKDAGLFSEDDHVVVTHDFKVYRPNMESRRKHHAESARLLLGRLKDTETEHILSDRDFQALEYLSAL